MISFDETTYRSSLPRWVSHHPPWSTSHLSTCQESSSPRNSAHRDRKKFAWEWQIPTHVMWPSKVICLLPRRLVRSSTVWPQTSSITWCLFRKASWRYQLSTSVMPYSMVGVTNPSWNHHSDLSSSNLGSMRVEGMKEEKTRKKNHIFLRISFVIDLVLFFSSQHAHVQWRFNDVNTIQNQAC